MTKRSIVMVVVYTLITAGLYEIYWLVKTKRELVAQGAVIPTSWLLIVPFVNLYWRWKWAEGVEYVTHGRSSAATNFLLVFLPGYLLPIVGAALGAAVIQSTLNDAADLANPPVSLPQARVV